MRRACPRVPSVPAYLRPPCLSPRTSPRTFCVPAYLLRRACPRVPSARRACPRVPRPVPAYLARRACPRVPIECGIVKLPRVPVAENIPGSEMPVYRDLWENIRHDMPKKGRGRGGELDPLKLPTRLQTAMQALYGHYEKTFKLWEDAGIRVPPCFIVVCQNTAISKLVYDFISGFHRKNEDGTSTLENGRLALFRNFDETTGNPLPRPNTLLIDSEQLEAGDALDDNFRGMAADEIERFRREIVDRTGDARAGENLTDQELLREVMNTVGKPGQLGGSIRCVVSVSTFTEGWDSNTITHKSRQTSWRRSRANSTG